MSPVTLRSLPLLGMLLLAVNCRTTGTQVKPKVETVDAFAYTKNDRGDCSGEAGRLCIAGSSISAELKSLGIAAEANAVTLLPRAVTNAEYGECVKDLHCDANAFYKGKNRALADAALPALGLPYEAAMRYCAWTGGRLPTRAELKAGMAGASFVKSEYSEWSNDWVLPEGASCTIKNKNICEPANPMGVCSGIYPCDASLKSKATISAAGESEPVPVTARDRIAFRCASDYFPATKAPPWMIKNPPAPLAAPAAPGADELRILHQLEATDTLNKPICKAKFTSPAHCKDPVTYFTPNESQNYLFAPYIRNLGGGYAGVAADANYSYIALAKSRFVWLFDFDVNINALHRILRALILDSETIPQFLARFEKKSQKTSLAIIKKNYESREDLDFIQQVFRNNADALGKHYKKSAAPDKKQGDFGWLRFAEHYNYIRLLYQQDRIAIVPGDMLKDKSMRSIGKAAKALGVPIRVYYPSNAEEFWDYSTSNSNYKRNILSLPFDEASITFRSVHEYPWHPTWRKGGFKGFWHYVVHGAYNYQKKLLLPHYDYMDYFKMHRVVSKERVDFSTIEIPSAIPQGILEQDR